MQTAGPLQNRVKTGPLKFSSEHWPGVFVRGDDAMYVEAVLRRHAKSNPA